ncbi:MULTISPECIES: hypothetical protein [unclassified Methylobacterium]|uniref:hypothetical protein n=1 Tax=unclassified Methylobacterium TaxID=2615210 RepID=UPI0005BC1B13|nr:MULTISPECIES: hypothetical protein [unclassified Methylobacterium]SFV11893.1 hypothetical protein SAMN02799643_05592 [Methylobacterium sp. UNCCL125]
MSRRVYAEGTKVPIAQSRAQIETMLRKAGANRIVTMDEALETVVAFMLAGRLIRLRIEIPGDASDQRRRAIWRAIGLVVKAKIEAVAQGITTVEQEWLAHIVLPNGRTVGDWIEPQLQVAYDEGRMPTEPLMLEGPR